MLHPPGGKHSEAEFFKDVPDRQLKQALIDRDMLDYRRFTTFIKSRREAMLGRLGRRLDLRDGDLAIPSQSAI